MSLLDTCTSTLTGAAQTPRYRRNACLLHSVSLPECASMTSMTRYRAYLDILESTLSSLETSFPNIRLAHGMVP